jgi:hypothetical protein
MNYIFGNSPSQKERISCLINYLKGTNVVSASWTDIESHYKKFSFAGQSLRQFHDDKKLLIANGVKLTCDKSSNTYSIKGKIPKIKKKVLVDDSIKYDLPILINLLNMEEDLGAVKWLKKTLDDNYNIDEKEWENETYFSSSIPELQNQHDVLKLSIELIKHMKNGNVLTCEYKPVDPKKPIQNPIFAPLQVRLYDARYYLIAAEYVVGKFNILDLKVMAIDQIRDWKVNNYQENEKPIHFDYDDFVKKSKLKTYFNYCVGVTIPKEKKIIYTYTIRFTGWAKSYVKNRFVHHSQVEINKNRNKDKDYVDIQIEVYDTFELLFILAKFREYHQIIDKKELKF